MEKEIEEAFRQTTAVVLGKALEGIAPYEEWLLTNTRAGVMRKSVMSEKTFLLAPFIRFMLTKDSIIEEYEALEEGKKELGDKEVRELTLDTAAELLRPLAHYSTEQRSGKNVALDKCTLSANCSHCYKVVYLGEDKLCACSTWPRESEHCFGGDVTFSSHFCLKCYNSSGLKRCFEVSDSYSSSDCYFCHNVENCAECMFCFNVKSKRYAIGNVEYPKEEYLKIKKRVLAQMVERLEKDKKLEWSIYNLGDKR